MKRLSQVIASFIFGLFMAISLGSLAYDASLPVSDTNPPPVELFNGMPTYRIQASDVVPASGATDVLTVCGSSTHTIYVTRVELIADAGGASVIDLYLFKRTTANTGGTATHPAPALMDSNNAATTATISLYSANPATLGTGILIAGDHYGIPAATGNTYFAMPWIEDFGNRGTQPLILHGVNECLAVSLNGQALPSGFSLYAMVEYLDK